MGSAASSPESGLTIEKTTDRPLSSNISTNSNRNVHLTKPKSFDNDGKNTTLIRTSQVAPIVIKNCREEFQHVTDFKEPLVFAKIADNLNEHALIKNLYFMVRDIQDNIDECDTMKELLSPNFLKVDLDYPIYSSGQPTKQGLRKILNHIRKDNNLDDLLLINLRTEPILFLKNGKDAIPYSMRRFDKPTDCLSYLSVDDEHSIRKEVIDLASLREDNTFFFYDKTTDLEKSHQKVSRVAYEDDLYTTDEIYADHTFNNKRGQVRYIRLAFPVIGFPKESSIDSFLDIFRTIPNFFDASSSSKSPAILFTCWTGSDRSTLGKILAVLLISHKTGFPLKFPKEKTSNDNYWHIQQLVDVLPNGQRVKDEVDWALGTCSKLYNLKNAAEAASTLNTSEEAINIALYHLERYLFVLIFNAYLHSQYRWQFGESFSRWTRRQSRLYEILNSIDIREKLVPPTVIENHKRVLLSDNYIGLDVLGAEGEFFTPNVRKLQRFPIYGSGQCTHKGLKQIISILKGDKYKHPKVLLINLREDPIVECDGKTYSWRNPENLHEPVDIKNSTGTFMEEIEMSLKKTIEQAKTVRVVDDIKKPSLEKTFADVKTPRQVAEMFSRDDLAYYRAPIRDYCSPREQDFDFLLTTVNSHEEFSTDEDGPAVVLQCRTGKGRTTTAMAITCLIVCHKRGFPYGTKPGEEERVSIPWAHLTKGNYKVVQELLRKIPNGHQMKREVDFVLDSCSDTMTPMHYHMREVAAKSGVYDILDNLMINDYETPTWDNFKIMQCTKFDRKRKILGLFVKLMMKRLKLIAFLTTLTVTGVIVGISTFNNILSTTSLLNQNLITKLIMGTSDRRVMHVVKPLNLYFHAAFFDDRENFRRLRIFGIQRKDSLYLEVNYYCILEVGQEESRVQGKRFVIETWPAWGLAYSVEVECNITQEVDKVQLEMVTETSEVYVVQMPIEKAEKPDPAEGQKDLAVCIKCLHGEFPPERLVEWIETLKAVGVEKFFIYDSGLHVSSRYVFDYYQKDIEVTYFPFTNALMRISEFSYNPDNVENYSLMQHLYILSLNDCLYRHYKQYKFFMIIDLDEMILPTEGLSIVDVVKRLAHEDKKNPGFLFPTSWHFEDMGPVNDDVPNYLYFQKYAKSGSPIDNQPKSIVSSHLAELIQWHCVVKPIIKNNLVPWKNYGYTHHYRGNCTKKFDAATCSDMLRTGFEKDLTIVKYKQLIAHSVKHVLQQLQFIDS
ncbi:DgyrCDS7293 [Dimorphilus gyrociliatus]|uniref:DgyrCDS7293 n=1 Tax=Dimorphilus gyrociliatus TaxID=2664684 RepID=A0A7I8VVK6_9ANNE|nr:DgyrCDS7293 [Dimorphilus gyrociliatus]